MGAALFVFLLFIIFIILVVSAQSESEKGKKREVLYNSIKNGQISGFCPTISISNSEHTFGLYVDEKNKKILVADFTTEYRRTIPFNDIIECSILENGSTVQSGGVGRAIVGGALAGGVGAIVGATTRSSKAVLSSLTVRIVTKNINNALCEIPIIRTEIKRDSNEAKEAIKSSQQIYATIISIIDSVNKGSQPSTHPLHQQADGLKKVVIPLNGGGRKIEAIKAVREVTGLDLADAKDLVEQSGIVKDGISYESAQLIAKKFKDIGVNATILESGPQVEYTDSTISTSNYTEHESSPQPLTHDQLQSSVIELLQQLADLRDKGILTEAEFTAKKREILGLNSLEE